MLVCRKRWDVVVKGILVGYKLAFLLKSLLSVSEFA